MFRLASLAFVIFTVSALRADDAVSITRLKDAVEFKVGDELVTRYHIGESVAKPYFWPVNAPGNIPVTRAWPLEKGSPKETTDHVHQKSIWFCHGDVLPEGLEIQQKIKGVRGVDFWSEAPGHGIIVCTEAVVSKEGPGSLKTRNEWRTADGKKILDETRVIGLKVLPNGSRLLTLDIDMHANDYPITFDDTKEGSMGVRVSDEIVTKNGGRFTNAEGKVDEKAIWGQPSPWCDYVGRIGGKTAGIALFDDPNNKPSAVWHARGYGLMAANPFGRDGSFPSQKGKTDLVRLAKGDHLKLRYGILIHAGDTKEAKVADAFAEFSKKVN